MAYSKLNLSKTYLNSQCTSLYCFIYWKGCNIILLTLQYNLVQAMPFPLTSAISLSANMQSVQTMPVLRSSFHWPILQWQTILASLSQTTPILQFHSSSSKIPFFSKCIVFPNILFSSNPPLQYNSLCNSMLAKTKTTSFCASNESTIQWPACMQYLAFLSSRLQTIKYHEMIKCQA